jgi:CheY-like chemotaxis protein
MPLTAEEAHEINNLLVYVILGLELIDREAESNARLRAYCRDALDGAERVRMCIRRLRGLPASPAPAPVVTARRARVLLIDDEPRLGLALSTGLDAEVVSALSGAEALRLLGAGGFDLILCDLKLPDISGIDVYNASPPELRPKFVFITGGAQSDTARDFLAKVPHLDKPFRLEQIEALLARR